MGVLTLHFTQELMRYQADVQAYYTSYYLAKAWLELGLTQAATRGIGFNYSVNTWDAIVQENISCSGMCLLSVDIIGKSELLGAGFRKGTWCNKDTAFSLSPGGSLIVPLFIEEGTYNNVYDTLTTSGNVISLVDFRKQLQLLYPEWEQPFTFGILVLSWEELYENGMYFHVWTSLATFFNQFDEYLQGISADYPDVLEIFTQWKFSHYLLITNTESTSSISFCVQAPINSQVGKVTYFPTQTFYIKSTWVYRNTQVGIQALYKQPLPDFLLNTYSPQ